MQKVCKNTSVEIDSWNQESLLPGKLSNKAQVGNPTKSQVQGQIFDLVLRNVHLSIDRYFSRVFLCTISCYSSVHVQLSKRRKKPK